MSVVELIVGILLLINPVGFISGIIIVFGIILMICGLVSVVKYFRAEPEDAAVKQLLAKGLAELLLSAFLLFLVVQYWPSLSNTLALVLSSAAPLLIGCVVVYLGNILMSAYENGTSTKPASVR